MESKVHTLMENWDLWLNRIIGYARIESSNRRGVVQLLSEFDAINSGNKGM